MAYKLLDAAQERWRRFNGHELVTDVLAGAKFKDGIRVTDDDNDDNEMTTRGSPPDDSSLPHPQLLTVAHRKLVRSVSGRSQGQLG